MFKISNFFEKKEISYHNFFYYLSKYLILLLIILLPFFFLTNTSNFTIINKTFLLSVILSLAFIAFLNNILINKELEVKVNLFILIPLLLFLITAIFSSFLSSAKYYSIYGLLSSSHSLNSYFLYILFFLISFYIFKKEDFKTLIFFLLFIFLISSILSIVSIFYKPLLSVGILFIGSISDLIIFLSVGLGLSILLILNFKSLSEWVFNKKLFYFLISLSFLNAILSTFLILITNFNQIWLILSLALLILLAHKHFHFTPLDKESFYLLTFLMIFIIFYFFSPYISTFLNNLLKTPPILESRPNLMLTSQIVFNSLEKNIKNLLIGTGPNTFLYNWLKYKPVYLSQIQTRFDQGYNFIFTLLSEVGFIGFILFLFIVLYSLLSYAKFLNSVDGKIFYILFLILTISVFYYPFGLVNGIYLFLFLGILTSLQEKAEFTLRFDKTKFIKIFSFIIYSLLILGVIYFIYIISLKYIGNIQYTKGIIAYQNNDLNNAINHIFTGINFDPTSDLYYRDLSFLIIQKLNKDLQTISTPTPEIQQFVLNSFTTAINYANMSIALNQEEPLNYFNLATIYQNLGLNNQQVFQIVVNNYKKAIELDPTNHTYYLNLGLVYLNSGHKDLSKQLLQTAYSLNPDPQILNTLQSIK